MKFFTPQWWCGNQCGEVDLAPHRAYASYFATIRDQFPREVLALQEAILLHDGRLRELDLQPLQQVLSLRIDGDDGNGGLRVFTLKYSGLSLYRTVSAPDVGLPGPCGYGDWGYDELDIVEPGEYEHRVLFSSGIEMTVRFTTCKVSWTDGSID